MKIGTILVATDTNPLYCDFIPSFVRAWKALVPEADICIVMIADNIPERFSEYAAHIRLFPPIPGLHTAFQAQCIRLLYPRQIARAEGVLITDMDMLPMNRRYYVNSIHSYPDDAFVVYRDVCLPGEISMCYNVALPAVWSSMFGDESIENALREWYVGTSYSGMHGGAGWGTDQTILVRMFNQWNGTKVVLNDRATHFRRLDRGYHKNLFRDHHRLRTLIRQGVFADYHCFRPYRQYREMNDFVVSCLEECLTE